MQWGWNPDTVAAITTALAALAAVIAGFFAWGAYQAERDARDLAKQAHKLAEDAHRAGLDREQRAFEDKKRKQAEMVSAWTVLTEDDTIELRVQNLSSAPVYSACLGIVLSNGSAVYARRARVIPPSGRSPMSIEIKESAVEAWQRWAKNRMPKPVPFVEFTFHDASGNWWFRDGSGSLIETTENEAYRYG